MSAYDVQSLIALAVGLGICAPVLIVCIVAPVLAAIKRSSEKNGGGR